MKRHILGKEKHNLLKLRMKASVCDALGVRMGFCERDENRSFLSLYMMKMNGRATASQTNKKQTTQHLSLVLFNASKIVCLPMKLAYTGT